MAERNPNKIERWANRAITNPKKVYQLVFLTGVASVVSISLFPFYWLTIISLTPPSQMSDIGLIPTSFNISVISELFNRVPFHRYILNSILIALVTTIIILLIASFAGYAFGRFDFRGKTPLLVLILIISYFPPVAYIMPLFNLLTGNISVFGISSPDLYNTPGALITPFSGLMLPLSIFILTTFYGQIPDGLEDAARVEGNSRLGALFRIIMPLSAPGLATAGILTFITVYNEFFFSYLMVSGDAQDWSPILWGILRVQAFRTEPYHLMAIASLIGVLPVVALVFLAQEKIVSGLAGGALKG